MITAVTRYETDSLFGAFPHGTRVYRPRRARQITFHGPCFETAHNGGVPLNGDAAFGRSESGFTSGRPGRGVAGAPNRPNNRTAVFSSPVTAFFGLGPRPIRALPDGAGRADRDPRSGEHGPRPRREPYVQRRAVVPAEPQAPEYSERRLHSSGRPWSHERGALPAPPGAPGARAATRADADR